MRRDVQALSIDSRLSAGAWYQDGASPSVALASYTPSITTLLTTYTFIFTKTNLRAHSRGFCHQDAVVGLRFGSSVSTVHV